MLEKCQNIGRFELHTTTTWQKNDIKHKKYYQRPEHWLGLFVDTKP